MVVLFVVSGAKMTLASSTYYQCDYNNNRCGYYPSNYFNNNYYGNSQYSITPYITSTVPYSLIPIDYSYYNNYQYPYGNYSYQYQYNYPQYAGYSSYYYNNYSALTATCNSNKYTARQGEPITWRVYPVGGSSRNYTYIWTGTDNPQSLNLNSINVTYQNVGPKTMSVNVISADGQRTTAYCGTSNVIANYYNGYIQPFPYFSY